MVYVWTDDLRSQELEGWIEAHGEFQRRHRSRKDEILSVETGDLPQAWRQIFARPPVLSVSLEANGHAVVLLHGSRPRVQQTIEELSSDRQLEQVVQETKPPRPDKEDPLTPTERKALVMAFEEGYLDVPRGIRLADMADKMGRSDGATSQLLRRAIRRLVASYVAELPGGSRVPPLEKNAMEEDGQAAKPKADEDVHVSQE